jgi:lipopolysaccharide export system permease protein
MTRIDSYLLKLLLTAFLFAGGAVTFVVLFTQSFRLLSFVIDNSATMLIFFQLMALMIPTFLPLILPLSLAIAVLFIYNKLSVDSELVVMSASGLAPMSLARPALMLAGAATLIGFLLTTWITPAANRQLVALQYQVRDNFSVFLIKPGAFNDLADGLTFYVRTRGNHGELEDILVHDIRHPDKPVTIMAKTGLFTVIDNQPQIVVFKGKRQELDRATGRLGVLAFDRYALDLQLLRSAKATRLPDPREQTMAQLLDPPKDSTRRRTSLDHIRAELHQRLAAPLLSLAYALIGLTVILAGDFNRRGMGRKIALASIAIVALQGLMLGLGSLAGKQAALAPLLYLAVLFPVPFCLMILRGRAAQLRAWLARCCLPLAAARSNGDPS